MKGHVVVVAGRFPRASETFVVDHVLGLQASGWKVTVATPEIDRARLRQAGLEGLEPVELAAPRGKLAVAWAELRELGVLGIPALRSQSLRWACRYRPGLRRLLAAARPDAVHAHFAPCGLIAAPIARELGLPVLVDFHGSDVTVVPRAEGAAAYRRDLHGITGVAHSGFIAKRVRELLPIAVEHVPLGVDPRRFRARARQQWGRPIRLLLVGRMVAIKGHRVALAALRRLGVPARLVFAGTGPEEAALRAEAAGLDVEFLGEVTHERVAAEMDAADVLLVPSLRMPDGAEEGFGRVAVEGLACGLPVLGTSTGGLPEAIGHEPWLVPPGDPAALAAAIERVVAGSAAGCAAISLAQARRFDIARMHAGYDRLTAHADLHVPQQGARGAGMNVLHFSPFLSLTGAQRSMLVLARAQAAGAKPVVVTWEEGPIAAAAREAGVAVELVFVEGRAVDAGKARRFTQAVRTIAAAVEQHDCAIVHVHSAMGNRFAWPAARWTGRPLVTHQRDIWRRDRFHAGLGLADRIVAISDAVLRSLPPRLASRSGVIPNAVFAPPAVPVRAPGPLRIGMAGRPTPTKGLHLFLDAGLRLLRETDVELHLWGLDDSAYARALVRQVAELPPELQRRCSLVPFRDDVEPFYAGMDVVVVPSIAPEPFGRVAIEGMAFGSVVVAAAHGGLVEIVDHGRSGLLFRPGDAEDLLAQLRLAVADAALRERLGGAARREVERRFTPQAHAAAVQATYLEAAAARGATR